MLNQLANYAREQKLDTEPGFAPRDARWAAICSSSGDYLGLIELGHAGSKNNKGKNFAKAPNLTQGELVGSKGSHFLIETAGVLGGIGKDGEKPKTKNKRAYFIGLLNQAASAAPELRAAANALDSADALRRLRADLEEHRAKEGDKITIQVNRSFPVELDAWHNWWRDFRRKLGEGKPSKPGKASGKMLCFLTGKPVEPAATHEIVRRLSDVGGSSMGSVLIGFDKESSCSYGLEQSANAAMSAEAAKTYVAALNDLIENQSSLVAGTKVVHWFRGRVAAEDDPLAWLTEGNETEELNAQLRARKLLESIRAGERPDLAGNTYFALTLSGNAGRVVVRDWMEGSFEELVSNVNQWFSDLEIVNRYGSGSAKPPKLAAVLAALGRELKDVPASMSAKFYRVAVRGEPIPLEAMAQALTRARIDVIQGEPKDGREKGMYYARYQVRIGLIKAYHLRKQKEGIMDTEVQPTLNPEIADPAYQCGRLMAALAKLQTKALGDVGAGVVQRYYAAASATPALVFGRLIRGAQFHLNKIEQPGLARWYERQIAEICGRIGKAMPATLSLEEQSRFALGYYQQLAALSAGKSENSKAGEDHE